eukprot:2238703-Ditylum_brightwellii.AAC.1
MATAFGEEEFNPITEGVEKQNPKKIPIKRLKIARDIENGPADVHGFIEDGINGDGYATFVHLGVNPANIVAIGKTCSSMPSILEFLLIMMHLL